MKAHAPALVMTRAQAPQCSILASPGDYGDPAIYIKVHVGHYVHKQQQIMFRQFRQQFTNVWYSCGE